MYQSREHPLGFRVLIEQPTFCWGSAASYLTHAEAAALASELHAKRTPLMIEHGIIFRVATIGDPPNLYLDRDYILAFVEEMLATGRY